MKRRVVLYGLCFLAFLGQLKAQTGEGGGVYLEDGGKLIGTVVKGNSAAEGFGIAGGDAWVVNCTVSGNEEVRIVWENIQIGDVFCTDGSTMSIGEYRLREPKDAIGVVIWTTSDRYSLKNRMYVTALQEELKKWGKEVQLTPGYASPAADTACYSHTAGMVALKDPSWEAAVYCNRYADPRQQGEWKWALPAGYQMGYLFLNRRKVNQTLAELQKWHPDVQLLEQKIYWTATEGDGMGIETWTICFDPSTGTPGNFMIGIRKRNEACGVRPVLRY